MCGILCYKSTEFNTEFLESAIEELSVRGFDSLGVAVIVGDRYLVGRTLITHGGKYFDLEVNGNYERNPIGPERFLSQQSLSKLLECIKFCIPNEWSNLHKTILVHTRWATSGKTGYEYIHPVLSQSGTVLMTHNGSCPSMPPGCDFDTKYMADLAEDGLLNYTMLAYGGTYACVWYELNDQILMARRTPTSSLLISDNCITSSVNVAKMFGNYKELAVDENILISLKESNPTPQKIQTKSHFMLEEILSQVTSIDEVQISSIEAISKISKDYVLTGCGSSYHAALYGGFILDMDVVRPYSMGCRNRVIISQSGESVDLIKSINSNTILITNNPDSNMGRKVGRRRILSLSGRPERAIAATRTFFESCYLLTQVAKYKENKEFDNSDQREELWKFIIGTFERTQRMSALVERIPNNVFICAIDNLYPIACEAALKFKEVGLIHAEAIYSPEIKHGPMAMVKDMLTIFLVSDKHMQFNEVLNNISQVRANGGTTMVVGDVEGIDADIKLILPALSWENLFAYVIPFQIFALEMALQAGRNPDKIPNLAKEITV